MKQITELASLTMLAASSEALKKLVLTEPTDKDTLRAVGTLRLIGGKLCLQMERFTRDGKARHENIPASVEGEAQLALYLADFARANLLTAVGDTELRRNKRGEFLLLGAEKLRRKLTNGHTATVEIGGNDKKKTRILTGDEPFLKLLGVSDANGRVYDKKGAKFRQINRFLELIRDTLPHLPKNEIVIADLCCGKSYLSFAVYHYFASILGYRVTMTGVDLKPDVIADCSRIAEELGMTGLSFLCGDIAAFETDKHPDLVVSLHACDTATDLVLEKATAWEAKVILSTPCCHHELNHTLNCAPLAFIAEHAMLRQKLCDAATDALRLKLLEAKGYCVAALELIDPDDTPKNIMLRALRRPDACKSTAEQNAKMAEYRAARAFLLGGED